MKRACLAVATVLGFAPLASAEDRPPNVLLIMSDDMRAEIGSYGGRAITPHLDRLAARGVRFDRAYAQYPLCNPSRTSMLTGRHPTTTQLYGNRQWFGLEHPDWRSLPRHFKDQGYVTVRSGKIFHGGIDDTEAWTEGGEARIYGDAPSAERAASTASQPTASDEAARIAQQIAQDHARAPESDRWEAVTGDTAGMGDTRVADVTIEALRRHKDGKKPFFVACGFSKPHSPLVAPKRFFDLYSPDRIELPPDFAPRPTVPEGFPRGAIRPRNADLFIGRDATPEQAREMIRAYLACVSYVDWNVGRVLDALESFGLAQTTIVVFMGDHGYQLGEKGKWSKAGSLWEQGARVPFIVYDPRAKGNGKVSLRTVQLVDLYPTLTELCRLPLPAGLDGRSLRPLLGNPEEAWEHPAFTVWSERGRALSGVVVRNERWRYAEFFGPGAGAMLVDPVADPYETKNLVADPRYAEVVRDLSAELRRYAAGKTEAADITVLR
jgi:arylsulfatase A-like enzyme